MKRIVVEHLKKSFEQSAFSGGGFLRILNTILSSSKLKTRIDCLKDISFELESKEIVGIIGKNGSGKTTLIRSIAGIYSIDSGKITINGKLIPLIHLNIGLHGRLTVEENIFLCCSLLGLEHKEIKNCKENILRYSNLSNQKNTKVFQLSDGTIQKLIFSIAIHCHPDILLIDELFEVGDEAFRTKSMNTIKEMVKNGCSILLISHDHEIIKKYCNRIIWIENGKIYKTGKINEIYDEYINRSSPE